MKRKYSEYPDSSLFESAVVVKIFNKKEIRDKFLPTIVPPIFVDPNKRAIIFIIKRLMQEQVEITFTNITMKLINPDIYTNAFFKKNKVQQIDENMISDILYNPDTDCSDELFEEALEEVRRYAFCRYVEDKVNDIGYWNSYGFEQQHSPIIASSKAIGKAYDIIYNKKNDTIDDQLKRAKLLINNPEEYIPTFSTVLNSYIGGMTRNYVGSIIAKSGHCKSTLTDYNAVHNIWSNKVNSPIDIITPEEPSETRWRRVIAMINNLSTSLMRAKTIKVTEAHIKKVEEVLRDRLRFHDKVFKLKDVIDLIRSLRDSSMIYIDHVNSIEFPGTQGFLNNMISNMPALINTEKIIAKERNIPIINISQVNDKEIQRSERIIKAPRYSDAYGSSILYQASREFLSLWYPIKDYEENPISYSQTPPTINDYWIFIEKSSFSRTGKLRLNYNPEHAKFSDYEAQRQLKKFDYEAPQEETLFKDGE